MPCVTSGTQKWNGESPSFIARARVRMVEAVELIMFVTVHWPEYSRLIMMARSRSIEAVACVRKYLVAASVERGWWFFISTGMIASIFISKPIHVVNQ